MKTANDSTSLGRSNFTPSFFIFLSLVCDDEPSLFALRWFLTCSGILQELCVPELFLGVTVGISGLGSALNVPCMQTMIN